MTKILFLKQGSIVRGQQHVEQFVLEALARTARAEILIYDLSSEFRKLPPLPNRDKFMASYHEHLLSVAKQFQPDGILFLGGYAIEGMFRGVFGQLKRLGLRNVAWHADDPYYVDMQKALAGDFHAILTVDRSTLDLWRRFTPNAHYLPFGCPSAEFPGVAKDEESRYESDICFVGAPFKSSHRVQTIDDNAAFLASYKTRIFGATKVDSWEVNLRNYGMLRGCIVDNYLPPEQAMQCYAKAKINLNLHKNSFGHVWDKNSESIVARSPNERFFFLAGMGAFQLVDNKRPDLFSDFPDKLFASFDSNDSFRKQITYYLGNALERAEKATKLRGLMQAQHTYLHRIEFILDLLQ